MPFDESSPPSDESKREASPIEAADKLGAIAAEDASSQNDKPLDLRVQNLHKAETAAQAVNERMDSVEKHYGLRRLDLAEGAGDDAIRQYEKLAFDHRRQFEHGVNHELERGNTVALVSLGRHIIENQRKHGETVTPNQQLFEAIADLADRFPEPFGPFYVAAMNKTRFFKITNEKDTLVFRVEKGAYQRSIEEWHIEPWQYGRVGNRNPKNIYGFGSPAQPPRADAYDGVRHVLITSKSTLPEDPEFDIQEVVTTKTAKGITQEELDEAKKLVEELARYGRNS